MKKTAIFGIGGLAIFGLLAYGGYYLTHNVDWVRVYYKRFKAADAYVFDEISPSLKRTEPAHLIRTRSVESASEIRRDLIAAIWGPDGRPTAAMPEKISDAPPDGLQKIQGIASIDTYQIPVDLGYAAFIFLLKPATPNGRLVIYQHGYAGTVEEKMAPLFERLLGQGYTVAASNYPEYGRNRFPYLNLKRFGWYSLSHDRVVSVHPRPIRFYVEPIIVLLNAMQKHYEQIDMTGFSAGGWIATLAAAVDQRINRTITVAGGYPLYLRLRNFARESPPPQYHQPLLQAANYLEMYVLGAEGESRSLTQIFNRYDRCCYRNTYARLYEPAVREAVKAIGPGRFQAYIDETHADHKISDWAIERIIETLAADR